MVTSASALPSQVDLPIRDHGLSELPPLDLEISMWNRQMPYSCSGPAMGPRLLHCVALCLLGAGESWSEAQFLLMLRCPQLCAFLLWQQHSFPLVSKCFFFFCRIHGCHGHPEAKIPGYQDRKPSEPELLSGPKS